MPKNAKPYWFLILFSLIVLADIGVGLSAFSEYRFITKPLVISALIAYFLVQSRKEKAPAQSFVLSALIFSLIGDIALLFDSGSGIYFVIGLASFLLAHISYIFVFISAKNYSVNASFFLYVIPFLALVGLVFLKIYNGLNELLIPVIGYMLVILIMLISALGRFKVVNRKSFIWVFSGACLFALSDSILAIDKFNTPIPSSVLWTMSTYAFAQYAIIRGLLAEKPLPEVA